MSNPSLPEVGGRSAKFALILLVIVYVFNFIDRQILTILAEDLKADLNISDSDIGFLYGTAFAVFYSVVGIPMGKLADTWNRKNLISLGLAFWSLMTFLSGTAKSFLSLSIYRFGVGIGESSASPASYSLLSDYFSPKVRATVLSIYASGLYIGSGIGIFIGGLIVDNWNDAFPIISEAPFGLKGWQVAFMAVGLPGILLALITWQIKEPPRGLSEGLTETKKENPLKAAFGELVGLTPIGLLQAQNTQKELLRNFALLIFVLSSAYWLIQTTGDYLQWIAFGIGFYIVCNWIQGLRIRDKVAFELMFKSKALLLGLLAFPFITFVTYALGAFGPAFYIRNFGMTASEVGVIYGLITAFGDTSVTGWFNDYTDSLKFLVPLNASDSTLLRGGKLRIESNVRAKLGENTWRNVKNNDGAIEDSIIQRGNNVPIVRSRQSILSSLDGTLFQGDTIRFRATVFDRAGNSTSGEASESIFVLDTIS